MAINKNKLMDAARKARDKGQVDKAIKEYLRIVTEDPKDVRVWLKIGDLYTKKGAKPEATETYLKVAKFYSEQGFYLKAVAVYKQILKLDVRLVEVNLKLAELYRQLGLMSDAMQHFEAVAAHYHREGKTKEALATLRQLCDLDPDNVATRIKLAELYSKESMIDDAVAEFARACDFLRRNNRHDDFIKVAERQLWHRPDNVELNRELAAMYLARNDSRRALQKLQASFKADPRDVQTLALLAQAFQALDQKGKAVSVLKEMARVLVEGGKRLEAEDVYRRILALVPNDPDSKAYLSEGGTETGAGTMPPAEVADQVLEPPARRPMSRGGYNPTGSMPIVNPADFEQDELRSFDADNPRRGSAYRAASEARRGRLASELSLDDDFEPSDSSVHGEVHADEIVKVLTETDVYVKYGLHQKAIDHLARVFNLDPQNIEARERLKNIYLTQGRTAEALTELCRLIEQSAPYDRDRAEMCLRELIRLSPHDSRIAELAGRYRFDLVGADDLEVASDPEGLAEISSTGGDASAPVRALGSGAPPGPGDDGEEEVELDELDLDSAVELTEDELQAIDYERAISEVRPAVGGSSTMEVQLDQVEEATALGDEDPGDLNFDAPPPADALGDEIGYLGDHHAEPGGLEAALDGLDEGDGFGGFDDLDGLDVPVEEPSFDPADARRFDAEAGLAAARSQVTARDDELPFDIISSVAPSPLLHEVPTVSPGRDADRERERAALAAHFREVGSGSADHSGVSSPLTPLGVDPNSAEPPTAVGMDDIEELHAAAQVDRVPFPPSGNATVEDELDEADFYISQDLWDEARSLLDGLLNRFPEHPLILAKLAEVNAMASGEVPLLGGDLGADLDLAFVGESPDARPAPSQETRPVVLLEKPVDDADADTHYDLGLAYKEMGLHDEAIKAFHKVLPVPGREVQCRLMIGICLREQDLTSDAIGQFKQALYVEPISLSEKLGLYYEIGGSYEHLDDPQEALYYYEMVLKKDPNYRDVAVRAAGLRARDGAAGTGGGRSPSGGGSDTPQDRQK